MKNTLHSILTFLFLSIGTFAQETIEFNRIHGQIKAPIIVDEIIQNDDFKYDQFDKIDKYADKSYQIHTSLDNIPITFYPSGKGFTGGMITKTDYYDIITNIHVVGRIDTESKLGKIQVTETITQMKEDYEVNFKTIYKYTDLKVNIGVTNNNANKKGNVYTFLIGKNTQLTVKEYMNLEQSRSRKGTNTHTYKLIKVDEEKLEECKRSSFPCFNFSVYWDGKTSDDLMKEATTITQLRGEDPTWEPPSIKYLRENIATEPNSIGIYYEDLEENKNDELYKLYGNLPKGMVALTTADLSKIPGLKVLERGKIDKILEEIKLSDSGLVKEETKVNDNLMKEEFSILIKPDFKNKIVEYTLSSNKKEVLIKIKDFEPNEIFSIQKYLSALIVKEINIQNHLNFDYEKIYKIE